MMPIVRGTMVGNDIKISRYFWIFLTEIPGLWSEGGGEERAGTVELALLARSGAQLQPEEWGVRSEEWDSEEWRALYCAVTQIHWTTGRHSQDNPRYTSLHLLPASRQVCPPPDVPRQLALWPVSPLSPLWLVSPDQTAGNNNNKSPEYPDQKEEWSVADLSGVD